MSFVRSMKIALAFVGLLVGAGFATGKEVIQYFVSFGYWGIAGAVIAGIVMAGAGAVILQLGSYFLAREHKFVFNNLTHPIVSKFLDFAVTFTMFTVGVVMIAGAGSTLDQQFGWPAWIGSLIMVGIVMLTGLMDVDKVSSIISFITPFIIIAVIGAFIYSLVNFPADLGSLSELAQQQESPVKPWILSALNYNGLALVLGVSMCLVIGGSTANPREVGLGGLMGGLLYTVMLLMSAVTLLLNMDKVEGSDVPMLSMFDTIHPILASIMVWVIYGLIYNTCIGMFYALGRRLTAKSPGKYAPVFLVTCAVGFGISFVGFEALMTYVYPVIGYVGILTIGVMVAWWIKNREMIKKEGLLREEIHSLVEKRENPEEDFTEEDHKTLSSKLEESDMDNTGEVIEAEVCDDDSSEEDEDSSSDANSDAAKTSY
ncbi:hypothetical protein [uncultured Corynebacterium sp.]|uniref:YkvI family membrane protein n=1 Tax=uncultured Corynebacterium sp. TaxID=159447 RepID=UPI00259A7C6A|nr:hypothetical protein [uncultured Corynebacterium sp.]